MAEQASLKPFRIQALRDQLWLICFLVPALAVLLIAIPLFRSDPADVSTFLGLLAFLAVLLPMRAELRARSARTAAVLDS